MACEGVECVLLGWRKIMVLFLIPHAVKHFFLDRPGPRQCWLKCSGKTCQWPWWSENHCRWLLATCCQVMPGFGSESKAGAQLVAFSGKPGSCSQKRNEFRIQFFCSPDRGPAHSRIWRIGFVVFQSNALPNGWTKYLLFVVSELRPQGRMEIH